MTGIKSFITLFACVNNIKVKMFLYYQGLLVNLTQTGLANLALLASKSFILSSSKYVISYNRIIETLNSNLTQREALMKYLVDEKIFLRYFKIFKIKILNFKF